MKLYIEEWGNNVNMNYLDHNFELIIFNDILVENKF